MTACDQLIDVKILDAFMANAVHEFLTKSSLLPSLKQMWKGTCYPEVVCLLKSLTPFFAGEKKKKSQLMVCIFSFCCFCAYGVLAI